jgi:hypothetical protein
MTEIQTSFFNKYCADDENMMDIMNSLSGLAEDLHLAIIKFRRREGGLSSEEFLEDFIRYAKGNLFSVLESLASIDEAEEAFRRGYREAEEAFRRGYRQGFYVGRTSDIDENLVYSWSRKYNPSKGKENLTDYPPGSECWEMKKIKEEEEPEKNNCQKNL